MGLVRDGLEEARMKTFNDFLEAALHIGGRAAALDNAIESALEAVGKHVEEVIEEKFGEYQDAAGDYPKWKALAESTQKERTRLGFAPNEPLLRKGNLRESISYVTDSGPIEDSVTIGSTSQIVFFHEVGYFNARTQRFVEPRATHGPALIEERDEIRGLLGTAVVMGMTRGRTSLGVLSVHNVGAI